MMIRRCCIPLLSIILFTCGHKAADGGAPPTPEQELGYQTLTAGPLQVAIDPSIGGRIASFTYEGREILKTSRDSANLQWGSTVWTAPQSDWNWPPPAAFDQAAYDVNVTAENRLHLYGPIDPITKLQMIKSIRLAIDEGRGPLLTLRYQVYNRGEQPRQVAVWENTRLPFAGKICYPAGGDRRLSKEDLEVHSTATDGLVAISLDDTQPQGQKIFYDPPAPVKGRFLYAVYENDGLALLKSWRPPGSVAPGQAGLEIYLSPEAGFAELEVQGGYREIAPQAFAELVVFWQLFPAENLPATLTKFK